MQQIKRRTRMTGGTTPGTGADGSRVNPCGLLLTAAFAFVLLPAAEGDGCSGEVVIGDDGFVGDVRGDCDPCYDGCITRGLDAETCRNVCARGADCDSCFEGCQATGLNEEICRYICASDRCDSCYSGCMALGVDGEICPVLCAAAGDCDACYEGCLARGLDPGTCRQVCVPGESCRPACASDR